MNKSFLTVVILDRETFYKNQPIHKGMGLFFLNNSSLSFGHSDNKCLKSSPFKFTAKKSNEAFKNCSESKR